MTIKYTSDIKVELIRALADDEHVVQAARVSTKGAESEPEKADGLVRFLLKNRHMTPFEHNLFTFRVTAPIFVWREHMRHRIGFCLPGDAEISVGTWKNGQTKKIKDIYRDWKLGVTDSLGRTRLLPSTRNLATRTLNLETGLVEAARMVDVFESGVKPIIRIELASGHVLRCTPDHRIWSPEGWVKAGDVSVNDLLGRQGKVPVGERIGIPRRLREGIQFWTSEMKNELVKAVDTCHVCGGVFSKSELEMDHVIPVAHDLSKALDPENLAPICDPCHTVKSGQESWADVVQRRTLANGVRFEQVVSTLPDGEEMTYDIEMPAPWHNFIADGVVVHNSYNEESGRYKKLDPLFYVPDGERALVQEGKPGHYVFVPGDRHQYGATVHAIKTTAVTAYGLYESLLSQGVAREVARDVLPVSIFSTAYVTCNARSLMSFLSLRTKREDSTFPSYPLREIEMVAEQYESILAEYMPVTHAAFNDFGRVGG